MLIRQVKMHREGASEPTLGSYQGLPGEGDVYTEIEGFLEKGTFILRLKDE